MLRNKNLIPLSHQHQHALALCVRIDRASPIPGADLDAWWSEIELLWQSEIAIHFAAEEQVLFPVARRFGELAPLVDELLADHASLRARFSQASLPQLSAVKMSGKDLADFAQTLSAHIRKEERQLFEQLQKLIDHEGLTVLGKQLEEALKGATEACALPKTATALRSAK